MHPHKINILPVVVFGLFTSFLLSSCSQHNGRFRLEGHFKNLNQGEFYLYSPEQGTKDTIAVNDGSFVYERMLKDTVTLVMLFPNYSEMPIYAQPNAVVKMDGDVSHLRDTEVTGTKVNETMTAFRIKTNEMVPPDVKKEAQAFIEEHPESPISVYLLRRYFLFDTEPDYQQALKLCTALHEAQPQNQHLARLHTLLDEQKNNKDSGPLPLFSAVATNGDSVSNKLLSKDANVIFLWASWNYETQSTMRQLKTLFKENKSRMAVLGICLDASPSEGRKILERDSISWPNVCDSMLWQSPLLTQLGICTIPANILIDKEGNIVARNQNDRLLKEKIEQLFSAR